MDQAKPKVAAKRFRIWMIVVSLVVASTLAVAILFGIQNHADHVLSAQITQTEAQLRALGAQLADIKDREFKTMAEYVAAYVQIEPLLTEYDQKLREYSELYNTAQQRDQKRGVLDCTTGTTPKCGATHQNS